MVRSEFRLRIAVYTATLYLAWQLCCLCLCEGGSHPLRSWRHGARVALPICSPLRSALLCSATLCRPKMCLCIWVLNKEGEPIEARLWRLRLGERRPTPPPMSEGWTSGHGMQLDAHLHSARAGLETHKQSKTKDLFEVERPRRWRTLHPASAEPFTRRDTCAALHVRRLRELKTTSPSRPG